MYVVNVKFCYKIVMLWNFNTPWRNSFNKIIKLKVVVSSGCVWRRWAGQVFEFVCRMWTFLRYEIMQTVWRKWSRVTLQNCARNIKCASERKKIKFWRILQNIYWLGFGQHGYCWTFRSKRCLSPRAQGNILVLWSSISVIKYKMVYTFSLGY